MGAWYRRALPASSLYLRASTEAGTDATAAELVSLPKFKKEGGDWKNKFFISTKALV